MAEKSCQMEEGLPFWDWRELNLLLWNSGNFFGEKQYDEAL